jgi:haloacetate dehalogenase
MFDGFREERIETRDSYIQLRLGGKGPPLLLLHGYPQSHIVWHRMAPILSSRYTVIAPDLRGYGDSGAPNTDSRHFPYSKRAMAIDQVEVMSSIGYKKFAVCGHDRGARVAYRLALDFPEQVSHLCSLDVLPTAEMWSNIDKDRAIGAFHWMFLAQPNPMPETLIGYNSDFFLEWLLKSWAGEGFSFDEEAMEEYKRCFRKPEVIHATCEDYRAGVTIDNALDEKDRSLGKKIQCPVLFLWGAMRGFGGPKNGAHDIDPLKVWRNWAENITGGPVQAGHFLPEEAPDEVSARLIDFLRQN